jgi:hypothetical protein
VAALAERAAAFAELLDRQSRRALSQPAVGAVHAFT